MYFIVLATAVCVQCVWSVCALCVWEEVIKFVLIICYWLCSLRLRFVRSSNDCDGGIRNVKADRERGRGSEGKGGEGRELSY